MKRRSQLCTEKIGACLWELTEDLIWEIYSDCCGVRTSVELLVPKGFVTDGASCPSFLFSLCPPMGGPHAEAAVLHDYLYSLDSACGFSRAESDRIFLMGMLADGTHPARARTIYSGVRLGGWMSFKKCNSVDKMWKAKEDPKDWFVGFGGGDH